MATPCFRTFGPLNQNLACVRTRGGGQRWQIISLKWRSSGTGHLCHPAPLRLALLLHHETCLDTDHANESSTREHNMRRRLSVQVAVSRPVLWQPGALNGDNGRALCAGTASQWPHGAVRSRSADDCLCCFVWVAVCREGSCCCVSCCIALFCMVRLLLRIVQVSVQALCTRSTG